MEHDSIGTCMHLVWSDRTGDEFARGSLPVRFEAGSVTIHVVARRDPSMPSIGRDEMRHSVALAAMEMPAGGSVATMDERMRQYAARERAAQVECIAAASAWLRSRGRSIDPSRATGGLAAAAVGA